MNVPKRQAVKSQSRARGDVNEVSRSKDVLSTVYMTNQSFFTLRLHRVRDDAQKPFFFFALGFSILNQHCPKRRQDHPVLNFHGFSLD